MVGRPRDDLAPNLRSFAVGRYVIFYREATSGIEVLRFIHGARDHPNLLKDLK
ncbi:MAG: type II toxin-antitoxin system RelE/ParE family toxin [Magnetococcales bacterium]|nr:type II toxin-antitoxin system RelE/ParE family toxin [Magnetococcales bacterium]MBF0321970.1 type II toxin-antitoxin system RelE/ParE family toxin [Magnetococcales bacterium]